MRDIFRDEDRLFDTRRGRLVDRPLCKTCGHAYSVHDTGWDAAGCMVGPCACRCYVPGDVREVKP